MRGGGVGLAAAACVAVAGWPHTDAAGLAAAIRTRAKGYDVVLLEQRDKPGGRAYVYEDQGFVYDAGPTIITVPFILDELAEVAGEALLVVAVEGIGGGRLAADHLRDAVDDPQLADLLQALVVVAVVFQTGEARLRVGGEQERPGALQQGALVQVADANLHAVPARPFDEVHQVGAGDPEPAGGVEARHRLQRRPAQQPAQHARVGDRERRRFVSPGVGAERDPAAVPQFDLEGGVHVAGDLFEQRPCGGELAIGIGHARKNAFGRRRQEQAQTAGAHRFFNRELSWLAFNWRVLEEAGNPRVPLLERVRFVSISAGNLDEFYTVRVAGLRGLVRTGVDAISADGLTPRLMQHQQAAWVKLRQDLEAQGIHVVTRAGLKAAEKKHLEEVFLGQVFPILSPLAIDPAHPFPFIPNEGLALALRMRRERDGRVLQALLPIPSQIDRFLRLPAPDGEVRFLPLEELLLLHVGALFPGYELNGSCVFRILRDSDLEVEEEAEDLVREFETALKRRRRGEVVRLQISAGAPDDLKAEIIDADRGADRRRRPQGTGARRPARPALAVLHAAGARACAGP